MKEKTKLKITFGLSLFVVLLSYFREDTYDWRFYSGALALVILQSMTFIYFYVCYDAAQEELENSNLRFEDLVRNRLRSSPSTSPSTSARPTETVEWRYNGTTYFADLASPRPRQHAPVDEFAFTRDLLRNWWAVVRGRRVHGVDSTRSTSSSSSSSSSSSTIRSF